MNDSLVKNVNPDILVSSSVCGSKRNINFSFCFLYIALTLFLGNNVVCFLHLKLEGNSILALSHYITLPVLFLAVFVNAKYVRITKNEKWFIFTSLLIMAFQKIFMDKSAGMSFFFNSILEAILLCMLLRLLDYKRKKKLQKFLIAFIVIEFIIAVYEYFTYNIIFANDVNTLDVFTGQEEMRSYALHGHPLQNAFLVSIVMTTILSSKLKQSIRYSVFFLGYLALFCFNTRSSIYFMSVVLLINIWRDFFLGKQSIAKKVTFLTLIAATISYLIVFVQSHDMGSRLAIGMDSNDGSSYARFILINVLTQDMSLKDLLVGISTKASDSYMIKYSLVAIENSVVNLIMGFGLIFTILFFFFYYKIFCEITREKVLLYSLIFIMVLLFNTNNALQTNCPIMPVAIMSLFAFRSNIKNN